MLTEATYNEAIRADDAWSAEGRRLFGARWGDVRYTREAHGEPGTLLADLYARHAAATTALQNELAQRRA